MRNLLADLPVRRAVDPTAASARAPARAAKEAYRILPEDHRQPYKIHELLETFLDEGEFDEFQADFAPEMLTGVARLEGRRVGVITNRRGMFRGEAGQPPRFGGIVYTDSAEKVAYFLDVCDRHRLPLLFVQDVSGFMVGVEAEQSGIIRAGARMVEAMATARTPKIVLTVNHASGAGYYAMAGQGFDPDFLFSWPTGRMGVMEGESAVRAIYGPRLDAAAAGGEPIDERSAAAIEETRADYERQIDARYAAARGFVDAILAPEDTRAALDLALRCAAHNPGPHIGAFSLPDDV